MIDRYTKFVLTVIAGCLSIIASQHIFGSASAQNQQVACGPGVVCPKMPEMCGTKYPCKVILMGKSPTSTIEPETCEELANRGKPCFMVGVKDFGRR